VLRTGQLGLPIAAAVGFVLDDFLVPGSGERFSLQPLVPPIQGFWSARPWVEQVKVRGSIPPITPSPQSILLSPGQDRMIRIQDDIIAYNWRKTRQEYIGYGTIMKEVERLFTSVSEGVRRLGCFQGSATLSLSGVELTYVDKFALSASSLLNPSYDPTTDELQAVVSAIETATTSEPKFNRVLWSLDLSTSPRVASLDLDLLQRISKEHTLVTLVSRYKAEDSMQVWANVAALLNVGHTELIKRFIEFLPEEVRREWE